jgi:hypothetical protein
MADFLKFKSTSGNSILKLMLEGSHFATSRNILPLARLQGLICTLASVSETLILLSNDLIFLED